MPKSPHGLVRQLFSKFIRQNGTIMGLFLGEKQDVWLYHIYFQKGSKEIYQPTWLGWFGREGLWYRFQKLVMSTNVGICISWSPLLLQGVSTCLFSLHKRKTSKRKPKTLRQNFSHRKTPKSGLYLLLSSVSSH